jgi:hypothetical protein
MELDQTVAQWSLLVGFFLPAVLAFLIQTHWSQAVKSVVAFVACAAAAVPTAYLAGDLDGKDWFTAAIAILVVAVSTYQGFWKPTGIAPSLETKTNVTSGAPADVGDAPIDA